MKIKLLLFVTIFVITAVAVSFGQQKKRVLIYTKNGKGYVHDNIATSVKTLQKICAQNNIETDVSDDPSVFTRENLSRYSAVIFSNSNNEGFDNDAQRLAFMHYIQAGGSFMGIHSACASERQWPWFWAMVGGKFKRHAKLQKFDIKVIDPTHPSTDFLGDVWHWEDECYFQNNLNPDIHVLLAADLRTVEDDKLKEYPGDVFGHYFPLAWYHEFDGGHQFFTALGHKIEYYSDPNFIKHLTGGLLWVVSKNRKLDYSKATATKIELVPKEKKEE